MDSSEKQIYRFEDVEVDTSRNCFERDGEERHLRKKAFQVLVYLLEQRERLVTKDELMTEVWKDTAVTDDALVQCIRDIRRALGDDSHQPRFIKTVPKAGYRFIGAVECGMRNAECGVISESAINNKRQTANNGQNNSALRIPHSALDGRRVVLISILCLSFVLTLFVFLGQSLWQAERQRAAEIALPQTPGKKSIAVMYFENQSNSPELDWLRAGLADMVIADLSRSEKLTVLSRGQLHLWLERIKRTPEDKIPLDEALEIARRTRAEAVITGSFARLGETVRLEVQIYDVGTGRLQATESLTVDKPQQILTEIDLLSLKLANRLGANEQEKTASLTEVMTNNLEAYRYYSLAVEKAQALHNKEAIELLEKAVALDPEFALAHARIGYAYAVTWGLAEKGKPHLEKAFQLSNRLTEKDRLNIAAWYSIANLDYPAGIKSFQEIIAKYPFEVEAYWRLARLLAGEKRAEEAVSVLKQGLTIDPEAKDIYNTLGGVLSTLGKHDEAISARQRYVALAPEEANAYDSLGMVYQWAGDYERAIENYNRALRLNPNFEIALIHLANSRVQTGQYREAINLYRQYIEIAPSENERARGFDCIAQVYLKKKDFDSAEKAANEAAKIRNESVWNLLVIALERGDSAKVDKLEKSLFAKAAFNDRGARQNQRFELYYRGYIALKNGRANEAVENLKEALQHLPPIWNVDSLEDCLANAYLELGLTDEAIAETERILRLNPNYPLARFHLAQAYERKGAFDEARRNYQQFLQIWKDADADIPEIITTKMFLGI